MKTFVLIALLTLTFVTLTCGQATPSLGADPHQDTAPLYVASELQVYASKLLSKEARFLAEQDQAHIDFNLWYNDVLNRFMLQQQRYNYRDQSDIDRDLNAFKRQLSALKAEFSESLNNRQFAFDSRIVSNYWNTFTSKFVEVTKKLLAAGDQYNKLKRQQLSLYAELIEISGAYYDPNAKIYYLFNLGGPNPAFGIPTAPGPAPFPTNLQVIVRPPANWVLGNPTGGPLGPIATPYPDPSCKMGILYSKIVTLWNDYNNGGSSGWRQNLKRTFTKYQSQWVDLAQKWLAYRRDADEISQKLDSLMARITDLNTLMANIVSVGGAPWTVWNTLDRVSTGSPFDNVY